MICRTCGHDAAHHHGPFAAVSVITCGHCDECAQEAADAPPAPVVPPDPVAAVSGPSTALSEAVCGAVIGFGTTVVRCELPAGHDERGDAYAYHEAAAAIGAASRVRWQPIPGYGTNMIATHSTVDEEDPCPPTTST